MKQTLDVGNVRGLTVAWLTIAPGFALTDAGLSVTGQPTLEEWMTAGTILRRLHKAVPYAWGKWLDYGESRTDWGEKMSQALEASGLERKTLLNLHSVVKRVAEAERVVAPSPSHAAEVAAIKDPVEQRQWLEKARDEELGVRELRKRIKASRSQTVIEGDAGLALTPDEAVKKLSGLKGDDPEVDHTQADDILLRVVPEDVANAYARVKQRAKWWGCS